jgi:hypothetical protein
MKNSELTFFEGFLGEQTKTASLKGETQKSFDWNKAATIIKNKLIEYPNLVAEAGLQNDWDYTGGIIFEKGNPQSNNYTYLSSNWSIPTLIISNDDKEILEIECWTTENDRFRSDSKWDEISLTILTTQKT